MLLYFFTRVFIVKPLILLSFVILYSLVLYAYSLDNEDISQKYLFISGLQSHKIRKFDKEILG